jgi:hypothetical protein
VRGDGFFILELHDFPQPSNTDLKHRDELRIENSKTDETGDVANNRWERPRLKQLMFGLRGSVAVEANINTNKFHSIREPNTLLER